MLFIKWYFSHKDLTVQSDPSNIEEKIMKKMPVLFIGHGSHLAKKLAALREQGLLIIGSSNIVHNLRVISWEHIQQIGAGYDWAFAFRETVNQAIATQDDETLVHYEQLGEKAKLSVPTPEHYLPLLYIMALREPQDEITFFNDNLIAGSLSMTSVLVG